MLHARPTVPTRRTPRCHRGLRLCLNGDEEGSKVHLTDFPELAIPRDAVVMVVAQEAKERRSPCGAGGEGAQSVMYAGVTWLARAKRYCVGGQQEAPQL